jgi:hypothetical protein
MKIIPTKQSKLPPSDKPEVKDPVRVYMDIPLYYYTERGPVPWNHSIFCSQPFAVTVLETMNEILGREKMGLVHLGIYNPRRARKRNGTPIQPVRWSNHAYGEAIDWRGTVDEEGVFYSVDHLNETPTIEKELLTEIWSGCSKLIEATGRKPEIVNEGRWIHIGLWPERR